MTLYLVRHGQTDWNKEQRLQGQKDIPMNDEGIRQMKELADKLAEIGIKVDAIIASSLERSKRSAQIITDRIEFTKSITVDADFFPKREYDESVEFCNKEGIRQYFCPTDVLETEAFKTNPPNRCYFCKKKLFSEIQALAFEKGISYIAEGSNMDDDKDYRPGMKAVKELGILSPLKKVGLLKEEIRFLSKELGLPTWDKPSYACLASRFVYGEEITKEKLLMVEKAEQLLYELGFRQFRVRIHGLMARIEILPEEFEKLMDETVRQ